MTLPHFMQDLRYLREAAKMTDDQRYEGKDRVWPAKDAAASRRGAWRSSNTAIEGRLIRAFSVRPGGWNESRDGVLLTPSYPVGQRGKELRKGRGFGIRRRGFHLFYKR